MSKVLVHITVGLGSWSADHRVYLVACPHVGDHLIVQDVTILCDEVFIGEDAVRVHDRRMFSSEKQAREFQRSLR